MTPDSAPVKTWQVGPYGDDWCAIVHADTRGQARKMGARVDWTEFVGIRAIRVPSLDGKLITYEALLEAGYPETIEGYPLKDHVYGYIDFCQCDICIESRGRLRAT